MKRTYPVIFTEDKNVILVEVPDLDALTEGKSIEDAIEMARDAICIHIVSREENGETIPPSSNINAVDIEKSEFYKKGKSFVSIVDVDVEEYRRKVDTKPVRRNVSLPSWLNYEAEKAGINVSGVLQKALIETLNLANKY